MDAYLWALLTACIWGVVPILEKLGLHRVDPFTALFYRCFGVLIGMILLGAFIVKPAQIKAVDARSMILLVVSGFLASFVAQITFYHGLKIGDVSRMVPVSGTYPLIAFVLSFLILGESFTLARLGGITLIVAGAWMLR